MAGPAGVLVGYRILYPQHKPLDVSVLVKNTIAPYVDFVLSIGRMCIVVNVELRAEKGFEIINVHGPSYK